MKTPRKRNRNRRRRSKLSLQSLESRQLLAADFAELQNQDLPEDVNGDGQVSSLDAIMVMNAMRRSEATNGGANDGQRSFRDVNGDGQLTSIDALRVINRMNRERNLGSRGDNNNAEPPPQPQGVAPETRSIDGTDNNLADPLLGSTDTEFRRLVDSDYADGISEPSGADRASAREISNAVAAQDESVTSDRNLSDLVWQWGQFIDHDITLTGEGEGEEFNIAVPEGDPFFDPSNTGTAEISFTRSGFSEDSGVDRAREQVNNITAFIDGSTVYGSDAETAEALRAFDGGRLLTSAGDLLPTDESGFFLAGDVRANEQNGLTAMHTLWVREHNRIADEIAAENPDLTDEDIFQQARSLVIAEIQAITYNEYLPALLGRGAIDQYEGYDETVDPTISNLFATAAFRYGHTSLSGELLRLDDDGNVIEEGNLALRDAFFNPSGILEVGIDPLLKGLASNVSQEIDTQLVDDVRNFLFGPPGAGGFDLAALNIQRGRDHGLPDYNSAREQLGLERAETFADISSDPDVQARLAEAYESVDDVDVWVGALAEDHLRGASVGELVNTVLVEQFTALRDGDRFWYENVFEGEQLQQLQRTQLSDVIERNTDLTSIQDNAFIVPTDEADRPNRPDRGPGDGPGENDGTPPPPPPADQDPNAGNPNEELPPPPPPQQNARGNDQNDRPPRPRPPRPPRGDADPAGQQQEQGGGLNTPAVDQIFGELGA